MDNEVKTWLKDIEQAIIEINSFIPEIKNFKDFQKDLKTKRAVERNIEIIGEAMSRILNVEPWKAINECKLNAQPINDSDKDPQVIEIHYNSVLDKSDYLPQRVLIEISSRSLWSQGIIIRDLDTNNLV